MLIRVATEADLQVIKTYDHHISQKELSASIQRNRVYLAEEQGKFLGWLRYNLFWDNTPFMNMLFFLEESRGKGYGRQLVEYWEQEMKEQGYEVVGMTMCVYDLPRQFAEGSDAPDFITSARRDGESLWLFLAHLDKPALLC